MATRAVWPSGQCSRPGSVAVQTVWPSGQCSRPGSVAVRAVWPSGQCGRPGSVLLPVQEHVFRLCHLQCLSSAPCRFPRTGLLAPYVGLFLGILLRSFLKDSFKEDGFLKSYFKMTFSTLILTNTYTVF